MSEAMKDDRRLIGGYGNADDNAGHWCMMDLEMLEYVRDVELEWINGIDCPFILEISLDGMNWVTVPVDDDCLSAASFMTVQSNTPILTVSAQSNIHISMIKINARIRYIKLTVSGAVDGDRKGIRSMKVFGGQSPDFITGVDVSHLLQIEDYGGKYYDRDGMERDCLKILKEHGTNYVRLKVWNKPGLPNNDPAGYNDKAHVLILAERARKLGLKLLINFHYSDWWTDPGKQFIPEEWQGKNVDEMGDALYAFTYDVLAALKAQGTTPELVQVGNEITNGMLWDTARVSGEFDTPVQWDILCKLLKKGLKAVADVDLSIRTIIHIERGGDNKSSIYFFEKLKERSVAFDMIGLSYYPIWHGTLADFESNLNDLAVRYGKDIAVVETAYPYTTEDGDDTPNATTFPFGAIPNEYPPSVQSQANVLHRIAAILKRVPEGRGKGFFYWQPDFIPVKGAGWKYGEGCEWDDQTMFDFSGHALWSLDVFKMHCPE